MATFQHTASVDVPADQLFSYLAEPGNLPQYFPAITEVEPAGGERVHVHADLRGRDVESDAWLRADQDHHTLAWGAPGEDDYHGELTVDDDGPSRSTVTITLHTEHATGRDVQHGLEEAVAALAHRATEQAG